MKPLYAPQTPPHRVTCSHNQDEAGIDVSDAQRGDDLVIPITDHQGNLLIKDEVFDKEQATPIDSSNDSDFDPSFMPHQSQS